MNILVSGFMGEMGFGDLTNDTAHDPMVIAQEVNGGISPPSSPNYVAFHMMQFSAEN